MNRDMRALLQPFESPHASGQDLRYTTIYDAIREARRAEDGRLTQGVWEQDIKQADWKQVANLAEDVLKKKAKDLKVLGWLGEAWISLEGLAGLEKAVKLLQGLCAAFWQTLYPIIQEEDTETRVRCLEWIDTQWSEQMHTVTLSQSSAISQQVYALVDWIDGHHYAHLAKQSSDKKKIVDQANLLETVRCAIAHTPWSYYQEMLTTCGEISKMLGMLEDQLRELLPTQGHTFTKIRDKITLLEGLIALDPRSQEKPSIEDDIPSEPTPVCVAEAEPEPIVSPRLIAHQDPFQKITSALDALRSDAPYSPAIPLLQAALRWKDLSFLELLKLFEDVGLNPQQVLKLFSIEKKP